MSEYATQFGRPAFNAAGQLVARRQIDHGGKTYTAGQLVPTLDLTAHQIGVLWDQGWIDTIAPKVDEPKGQQQNRKK